MRLDDPRVGGVLAEIVAVAQRDDAVIDRARAEAAKLGVTPSVAQMSDLCAEAALPVRPEVGRLLYMLVRMLRPRTVVEFGTSFGMSLICLAAGVSDNGVGVVIGSEMNQQKRARAQDNVARAGLGEVVRILPGDARESLATVAGPIDMLLLDGWKELYLPVLEAVEPKLRSGSVVVADNLSLLPASYLEHVRAPGGGYVSIALSISDGIELSMRQR